MLNRTDLLNERTTVKIRHKKLDKKVFTDYDIKEKSKLMHAY